MVAVGNVYNSEYLSNLQYAKAWFLKCTEDDDIIGKKITEEEYEELKETYSRYTASWVNELESKDNNEYEISDNSLRFSSSIKEDGIEYAETKSGDPKLKEQTANSAVAMTGGVASAGVGIASTVAATAATTTATSTSLVSGALGAATETTTTVTTGLTTTTTVTTEGLTYTSAAADMTTTTATNSTTSILWMVGASVAFATGVLYEATRPNKEATECINQLNTILQTDNNGMEQSSVRLGELGTMVSNAVVQTSLEQEDKQKELAEKQELYEKALAVYQQIGERVKAGETLTAQEEAQYKAAGQQIEFLGEQVETLKNQFLDVKANGVEFIAEQQSNFDQEADNIAAVDGHATYAQSLDTTTKTLIALQIAAQTANAAGGITSASIGVAEAAATNWLFGASAWMWIFVGLGYAGAGMSTHGIIEQAGFLKDTNTEIDTRTQTQATTVNTMANYVSNMDIYSMSNDDINDIELDTKDVDSWSEFEFEDLSSLTTENNSKTDTNTNSTTSTSTAASNNTTTNSSTTTSATNTTKNKNPFA